MAAKPTAGSHSHAADVPVNVLRSHPAFIATWARRVPLSESEAFATPLPTVQNPASPPSTDRWHSTAVVSTRKRKRNSSLETDFQQPLETRTHERQRSRARTLLPSGLVVGYNMGSPRGPNTRSKDRGSSSPVEKVMSDMRASRRGRLGRRAEDTGINAEDDGREGDETMDEGSSNNPYKALDTPSASFSACFPPPGSSRRGASSPSRDQRWSLQLADPSVSFLPIESGEVPVHVTELFRELIKDKEVCIPVALRRLVENDYPSTIIPAVAYNDSANMTSNYERHWSLVKSVVEAAAQSQIDNDDENGWYKVVRIVLDGSFGNGIGTYGSAVAEITARPRMYSVREVLVPCITNIPIPFKKVDFVIAFSNVDPQTRQLYMSVFKAHPKLTLSQTEDAATGHMALLTTLEVKSPDGTYNAASVHLATWWAAGLEKMRQLARLPILGDEAASVEARDSGLMPFVGWTVVGHRWELHVAVKRPSGRVSIYGPVPVGDTSTCYGVFQILHVLAKVNAWGRRVYYPWLVKRVLEPLGV
ncbi:hypothetical protein FGG08_004133 [Glutinoglossum americanum]|uniref:PD-(D/E)XK nuclease-like domain-containing protein n=1 Tax=Glutinoglossum americanum TaxID=1670608 RepID=A0A9P8I5W1_9PEZI|nr:hypothetical protein FGG08_004133 [Glutinoglossum americanum]